MQSCKILKTGAAAAMVDAAVFRTATSAKAGQGDRTMRRLLSSLLVMGLLLACNTVFSQIVVPQVRGPIASNPTSAPWNASIDRIVPLEVGALGYVEEEFFVTGRASVYDWDADGRPAVKASGASYTTRILVRRPQDPRTFSGTVWINPSNPTLGADMDGLWGCCSAFLSTRHDIIVNVTFKPTTVRALKAIHRDRYEALTLPSPLAAAQRCDLASLAKLDVSMDYLPDQEDGLAWDLFTQIAKLVKAGGAGAPLSGYRISRVYGYGYSQDANYLRTYLNSFHGNARKLYGEASPFDGFLLVGGTRTIPINQCSRRSDQTSAQGDGAPVITVSTEADANPQLPGLPSGRSAWRPDSDKATDRYRHYDLAGTTHVGSVVYATMPSLRTVGDLGSLAPHAVAAIKAVTKAVAEQRPIHEIQQYYFITAMMGNLDDWSRKDRSPPAGTRFTVDAREEIVLDANGNAASGLRGPDITVPVATYALRGPAAPPLGFLTYAYQPFSPEKLASLYPSHDAYVARVSTDATRMVADRTLSAEGARALIDAAQARNVP